jgi:hypothetical protein
MFLQPAETPGPFFGVSIKGGATMMACFGLARGIVFG